MKKLFWALLIGVAVTVAALFLLPGFIDWNDHRDRIARELEGVTGRDVTIAGDVSLTILPTTAFSLAGVSMSSIEGGSGEAMLTLESLRVRLRPLALLQGKVEVESLELRGAELLLERTGDGRVNWQLEALQAPSDASPGGAGGGGAADDPLIRDVAFERIRILDSTLRFLDGRSGREERLERINAELSVGSLSGPFELEGSASYLERALSLTVRTGRLGEARLPLSLDVALPEAGGEARLRGHLDTESAQGPELAGTVTLKAGKLSRVLRALGGGGSRLALLEESLEVEGRLSASPTTARFSSDRATLGEQSADISMSADLTSGRPVLSGEITLPRLDLDAYLRQNETAGLRDSPADGASGEQAQEGGFALPAGADASLYLAVDTLIYRGQVVRELGMDLLLEEGSLTIERALALMPGGSDATLSGRLEARDGAPYFQGRVEGASDNLRGLLSWLGQPLDTIPRDRLRRASVTASVEGGAQSFSVSDLDLRFDLTRVTGGLVVVPGPKPGLGIGLSLDRIDLDAYLPGVSGGAEGGQALGGQALGGQAPGGETAAGEPDDAGLALLLQSANANVDLQVGELGYRGVTAESLYLDAGLQDGALDLRRLVIGEIAGSYLEMSGSLSVAEGAPRATSSFQVTTQDPARLAGLLGEPQPLLERLGPSMLAGSISGGLQKLDLDIQFSALSGTIDAKGALENPLGPQKLDLMISARHGQLGGLARALGIAGFERATPGALDLEGRLLGSLADMEIDLDAALGEGRYSASGRALNLDSEPSFDLALEAAHPEARALAESFGGPQGPALGAFALSAQAAGEGDAVTLSGLTASLGELSLSGDVTYRAGGARPFIDARLTMPRFDPAALPGSGTPRAGAGEKPREAVKPGQRWSKKPIDVSALRSIDGRFDLTIDTLRIAPLPVRDVTLKGSLDAGILTVDSFEGRYAGGSVSGAGTLDARTRPNLAASFDAAEVESKRVLRAFADFGRVSGPVSITGTLQAAGDSEAELVQSLAGLGQVSGTLTLESKPEEQLGAAALNILGQKVGGLRGITDGVGALFNAFAGRPASLSGNYRIEGGVLTSNDLTLESDRARVADRLTLDLPDWLLDTTADLYRGGDDPAGKPYLTLTATGPVDEPNLRVSGQVFAPPSSDGKAQTKTQPTAPLEEQLQNVIPGLLPGLQPRGETQQEPAPNQPEPDQPEVLQIPSEESAQEAPRPAEEAGTEEAETVTPDPEPLPEPLPAPPPPKPERQAAPSPLGGGKTEDLIQGILDKLTQ